MADPTVEEIVKATEYASVSQSVSKTSLLISATERILRDQKISISDSFKADFCYHFPIEYMTAYALASKAYDELVRERETLGEKPIRAGMMMVQTNEDLVINNLALHVGLLFLKTKPRTIIVPVHGAEYAPIINPFHQEHFEATSVLLR